MARHTLSQPCLRSKPFSIRRPTKRGMITIIKRFVKDGDLRNAVELIKIMYPESNIRVRRKPIK